MDMQKIVRTEFWSTVNAAQVPDALKQSLKTNERTNQFIQTLTENLQQAEKTVHKRRGTPLKLDTIKSGIKDLTTAFLANIEMMAERRRESFIAQKAREQAAADKMDLLKTVDGTPSGDFKEMGIVSKDTEVEEL